MVQRTPMTMQQIFEKTFKKHLYGYECGSVDEFLDEVIQDYHYFLEEIETLMDENLSLKKQLQRKPTITDHLDQGKDRINYDIIKRISNLEKTVFKDRLQG